MSSESSDSSSPPSPRSPEKQANNTSIGARAQQPPSCVTFCGIQVEISEGHPNLDIKFNRGKSVADIFDKLTLVDPDIRNPKRAMERRKHARGKREPGKVRVETFSDFTPEPEKSKAEASNASSKESTPASNASAVSSTHPDQLKFVSGNPFVEVTKGVLHLYKENYATSLDEGVLRSELICMLGVPAKIKTPDLLQFTAPCHSRLEMMRIIQDNSPNQYMVLLKFRCQEAADEFYKTFNGQKFNSIEDDVCSLVYVSRVETCKESEFFPLDDHTELPVCSICLERMDESISTVLTILCNHTFHSSCLAQWEDASCPVCRCVQTPEVVAEQRCSDCQSSEDLWICLVCGYIGCGRYVGGHSHAHFLETHHCYTMELGRNRVWDYVGDNFVHRLLQTDSADGKLVEAEGNRSLHVEETKCIDGIAVDAEEKLDSIQLEYTYLLTSQLEAQRSFYEEKLARLEEKANMEMEEMQHRTRSSVEETKAMEERIANMSKEKAKADQKLTQINQKLAKLNLELKEEKQLNQNLTQNQALWQKRVTECESQLKEVKEKKEKEIEELREQVRDLMFFMEAQQTIAKSSMKEEIQDGSVTVGAAAKPSKKGGRKKK